MVLTTTTTNNDPQDILAKFVIPSTQFSKSPTPSPFKEGPNLSHQVFSRRFHGIFCIETGSKCWSGSDLDDVFLQDDGYPVIYGHTLNRDGCLVGVIIQLVDSSQRRFIRENAYPFCIVQISNSEYPSLGHVMKRYMMDDLFLDYQDDGLYVLTLDPNCTLSFVKEKVVFEDFKAVMEKKIIDKRIGVQQRTFTRSVDLADLLEKRLAHIHQKKNDLQEVGEDLEVVHEDGNRTRAGRPRIRRPRNDIYLEACTEVVKEIQRRKQQMSAELLKQFVLENTILPDTTEDA